MTTKKPYTAPGALRWLPLVLVVIAGAAAWGQQKAVTATHDRRIQQNEEIVRELEKGQATILERTRQMYEDQKEDRITQKDFRKEIMLELRRQR